ncbi:hypothetical protein [Luteolibacter sp.]|uniref:hypothetical protein n=1 Tax=Luteolibacter sp. TaxID=1962973 RepID=UPI003266897A
MTILHEDPLDCEIGDAFPDDGRVLLWESDVDDEVQGSTLYNPANKEIDPNLMNRVFKRITVEIDGRPVKVALLINPEDWIQQYPYGWTVLDTPNDGQ